MYKDVGKRILAMAVAVCMVIGLMPEMVLAAAKSYYTYQHGSGSTSGYAEADMAAAVFTVGKSSSGGAEILDSVSFNAHVNEEGKDASATISYYMNPTQGNPASGTYVCAKPLNNLQEGLNSVEIGMSEQMKAGDTFSVVISLKGASLAYYGNAAGGQTYLSVGGNWQDANATGQCMAIRAYTYAAGDDGTDNRSWLDKLTGGNSNAASKNESAQEASNVTPASLNQRSMVLPVGGYDDIVLNDAEGAVTWKVADTSVAEIRGAGSTAYLAGLADGETTITAVYAGNTYTCALQVTSNIEDAEVIFNPSSLTYDGGKHTVKLTVSLGGKVLEAGKDYKVSCKRTDTNEPVNVEDFFTEAATYRFTIEGQADYNGSKTVNYTIAPKQITDSSITVEMNDWDPDSPENYIKEVTDTATGRKLNLKPAAVSEAANLVDALADNAYDCYAEVVRDGDNKITAVNLIGCGNYTGIRECKAPKSISKATLEIDESIVYTGEVWTPAIAVELDDMVLSEGDFEVTYEPAELKNAGTYTVTVTGKDAYWDNITTTIEIQPKDINADDVEIVVSNAAGGVGNAFVSITYNGMKLEDGTDYETTTGSDGKIIINGKGNYTGTYTTEQSTDKKAISEVVSHITVSGAASWTYTGETITPAVSLSYKSGVTVRLVRDVDYKVIYSNNVNAGEAKVTVQGIGEYGGLISSTFTIKPADMEELKYYFKDASGKEHDADGYTITESANLNEMKPEVVVRTKKGVLLTKGTDYDLVYSLDSSPSDFEHMSVTVTGKGNYTGDKTLNYSLKKQNLKEAVDSGEVTISMQESLSYTGQVQHPSIKLYEGGQILEENTDYKLIYPEQNPTDVKEYTVIIRGMGRYTGDVTKTFQITRTDVMSLSDIQAMNGVNDYNGSYIALLWCQEDENSNKLSLIIKNNAGIALEEGTDYELSYENIKAVSTKAKPAKVKITGKGNYVGEREIYYLLAGKLDDYELSLDETGNIVYTGKGIDLKETEAVIKVQKDGLLFKEVLPESDYALSYENSINAGQATVTVESLDDDLLPSETGCYRYADSSSKMSAQFTIKPKNIGDADITLTKPVKEYTGSEVKLDQQDILLTYNGQELQGGTDFTILDDSYANNQPTDEGVPSVYINGTVNYTGSRQIEFTIRGKTFDGVTAEIEPVIYTGEELEPAIVLKDADGTELQKNVHYRIVKYFDNVNVGTGKVEIKGIGVYNKSSETFNFIIKPRDIASADTDGGTLDADISTAYTYTSQEIKPEPVVRFTPNGISNASQKELTLGTDYELTYSDNVNVGTAAKLCITGIGNYTGTVEKTFAVEAKDIGESEITVADIPSQEYVGGMAVKPTPEISYRWGASEADVYQLTAGTDYTVKYSNNKNIGEATVTITGAGNFKGTTTKTFHIGTSITDSNKISVTCPDIEKGTVFTYNGKEHKPSVKLVNTVTGGTLSQDIDYTVTYKNNVDAGTAGVIVEGIGMYAGTTEFTFQIVPMDFAASDLSIYVTDDNGELVSSGNYKTPYTGSAIEPKITLMLKRSTLSAEGYTVSYAHNIDAGSAAVTVTAKENSNYIGTKTFENVFTIEPISIGKGGKTPAKGFTMEKAEPQPMGENNAPAEPAPKLYFNGKALAAGIDYTYSYENNTSIGTNARVILTGKGNFAGSVYQVFEICGKIDGAVITVPTEVKYKDFVTKNPDGTVTVPSEITFDDQITVTVNGATLTQGTDYDIKYSNNTWVGMATVTIKAKGAYAGGMETRRVPITADLSETTITIPDQAFTGDEVMPEPVIEYYGKLLTNGVDYSVVYENNKEISNQGATAVITGMNQFTGMEDVKFSIKADASTLTIFGVEESYMYRGIPVKPSVEAKLGSTSLEEGRDYTVLFGQNTNVGTYSVVVRGKDGSIYAGLLGQASFRILPWEVTSLIAADADGKGSGIADKEYTGEEVMPEISLTANIDGRTYTMPESDYALTYSSNIECGEAVMTITGVTDNITGSTDVAFNIVPKSLSVPKSGTDKISVEVTQDSYAYDGTAKEPEVVVNYQFGEGETKCRTLQKDVDYTVVYENNINAGTATVTVTGIGNYTGSRTAKFTIAAKDIASAEVSFKDGTAYPYMGSTVAVEPEVIVKDADGVELIRDKDYTVSYENNMACGTAAVILTGKGDFGGTATANFQIVPHSIDALDVTVAPIPNQSYTGSIVIPEVTITCGEYELISGTDYRLSGNSKDMGEAEVTIQGIGGFEGTRTVSFYIRVGIENVIVTGAVSEYPYTGQALTAEALGITDVTLNGTSLIENTDYSFGFAKGSDGVSAGEQTVVLTGINNYGGTKELTVSITPKNIEDADVEMTGFAESLPYIDKKAQNITLTWNGITLQKDTDYEVVCEPADKEDTYVMTVTGKGNYTGVLEREYAVERAVLDTVEITNISSSYTYTGKEIKPVPTVRIGDEILTEGEDYKLTYSNNVKAGTAVLLVKGTGKTFSGEKEVKFNILRRSITHAKANEIAAQIYTGSYIEPDVIMTYDGKQLTENSDYILSYNDNRTAGRAIVRVTGKGNYNAVKTVTFNIKPCDVTALAVTGTSSDTVSLSWKSDGTVTGYEIYRKSPSSAWQLVGSTQKTSYTDEKLSADTTYSYYVRSYITDKVRGTDYGTKSSVQNAVTAR